MKMLYIHNQAKKVNNFSHSSMLAAKELGIEFHIASNWGYTNDAEKREDEEKYGIKIHQIDFIRKPYDLKNIKAYKQVCELIQKEKYDVIHCNTPIGGVIGRLAGKKCGVNKVIYQAHGFHFYKGAPLFNWIFYYPIEKWLSRYTDCMITINKEDFQLANKRMHLKMNGKIRFVHGVGIDTSSVAINRSEVRNEIGLSENDYICISVGDLIKRKNYETSIKAIAYTANENIKLVICGEGPQKSKLQKLSSKLGIENQIIFLGFRNDIANLLNSADCYVFSTLQEGLPRSLMEAMIAGLPCVVSNIRGNVDLIEKEKGGFLCESNNYKDFAQDINVIYENKLLQESMGKYNKEFVYKFDLETVLKEMIEIYKDIV